MQNHNFMAESPESVGINPKALEELSSRVQLEVDEGLLPSAQIAIARKGKLALFRTFGKATNDSLYCIFSATKAITSVAAWQLIESGQLATDELVADIIPGFGANGKENIRVEQLFTHTCGFPSAPFRTADWFDKDKRYQRFEQWTLNWEPGSRFEYHPTSSMWVIADIIERRSEQAYHEYVRQHIADRLGLADMYVGLPDSEMTRVAEVQHVGAPLTAEDYAALGVPEPPVTEVTEEALTAFNLPEVRRVPVPGGGGIMSAAEVALFYQSLIMGGETATGVALLKAETISNATSVLTGSITDPLSGKPVNRALGVVIAGDEARNFRGFGHTNSPATFGHGGAGGQIAWGDPESGISIGYCTNGHDRNPLRVGRRGVSISNRAAVCARLGN